MIAQRHAWFLISSSEESLLGSEACVSQTWRAQALYRLHCLCALGLSELLFTEFCLNRSGQQLFGLCSSLSIFLSVWLLQMPFIVISSTFKSTVLSPWWHQSHGHSCKPLLIVQMCCGFRQPSSSQLLASTLHCLLPSGLKGEKSSNLWVEIRTVQ